MQLGQSSLAIGTEQHKQILCRMLLGSFDPYRPAVIDRQKQEVLGHIVRFYGVIPRNVPGAATLRYRARRWAWVR